MKIPNNKKILSIREVKQLINDVHFHFFQLDPEIVKNQIDIITENIFLLGQEFFIESWEYEKIIWEYEKKILPLNEFIGIQVSEDLVIKKIKNGEIKNKAINKNFLQSLKPEKILEIFNDDIRGVLNFLNKIEMKEMEKQIIFETFANNLLNSEHFHSLLPLLVQNNSSPLWKNYLTKTNLEKLIKLAQNSSPLELDEEVVDYLLDNNYINTLFMKNLNHMINYGPQPIIKRNQDILKIKINKILKKCNYSTFEELQKIEIKLEDSLEEKLEKLEWYELGGKVISMKEALNLLELILKEEIKLTETLIKQIIKSLSINMLKAIEVPNHGIYFVKTKDYKGAYNSKNDFINLNYLLIEDMKKEKYSLYQRLKILITMFHEMQHAKINNDIRNKHYNIETYEMSKENILRKYDTYFYKSNYQKVKNEMDARITGIDMLSKFIETYFPNLLDTVQDEIIIHLEKERALKKNQNKENYVKMFNEINTDFQQAFDTLIRYNPSILEKHSIFNLEYHANGTIKSTDEIINQRIDENASLIEDILKKRYSYFSKNTSQETTSIKRTR